MMFYLGDQKGSLLLESDFWAERLEWGEESYVRDS